MYSLIQEALWNIKKHADANRVTLRLVASFPTIILRIEDDGKGFDLEKIETKGFGMQNLAKRVSLLKGTLKIKSSIESGTKILVKIPVGSD